MKVMAINGSPGKTWNTAALLQRALKGAASQGSDPELIHFMIRFVNLLKQYYIIIKYN